MRILHCTSAALSVIDKEVRRSGDPRIVVVNHAVQIYGIFLDALVRGEKVYSRGQIPLTLPKGEGLLDVRIEVEAVTERTEKVLDSFEVGEDYFLTCAILFHRRIRKLRGTFYTVDPSGQRHRVVVRRSEK